MDNSAHASSNPDERDGPGLTERTSQTLLGACLDGDAGISITGPSSDDITPEGVQYKAASRTLDLGTHGMELGTHGMPSNEGDVPEEEQGPRLENATAGASNSEVGNGTSLALCKSSGSHRGKPEDNLTGAHDEGLRQEATDGKWNLGSRVPTELLSWTRMADKGGGILAPAVAGFVASKLTGSHLKDLRPPPGSLDEALGKRLQKGSVFDALEVGGPVDEALRDTMPRRVSKSVPINGGGSELHHSAVVYEDECIGDPDAAGRIQRAHSNDIWPSLYHIAN
jgi:hypothetical protein